jgi:DNA-binding transcriptional MerR regulator
MENRDECEGLFGQQLKECRLRIEALESQSEEDKDPDITQRLAELREKEAEVWKKYEAMKRSKEDEWQDVKGGVEHSIIALQDALDKSFSRFKSEK